MMQKLFNIFGIKKTSETKKYKGVADFFLHASPEEQKKLFTEVAQKANEDQMMMFKKAQEMEV